ncbi:uncharacterized protein LOC128953681 [Oppia nitens]|uniref:uncharacterized protein LOC128953681 n=1 Tax=Oppia nitens TaxID=1686743 RepID=UPI0023DAE9D8|nr:uncharacterized protein LOC128953681 [Oppia nitens]
MKLIIILISVLLGLQFIVSSDIKLNCNKNNEKQLDEVIQNLYLFGAPDRQYPTVKKDMKKFCSDNEKYQKFIKEYGIKCKKGLSKQVLGLMMYSVAKHSTGICKSNQRTNEFLNIGNCGNTAKNDTIKCWKNLIKAVDSISYNTNNKLKIPLICCNYYVLKTCSQKSYESRPNQCNSKAIDGHEKLLNAFALDTLKLLCSEYNEDNDKCDKIISQTGVSKLKVLPKSPIVPFIKILEELD